jgi:hypothetical protein
MSGDVTTHIRPVHLFGFSDDRATLCGIKTRDNPLPVMLARFVNSTRAGHAKHGIPFEVCADCYAEAHRRGLSLGEER